MKKLLPFLIGLVALGCKTEQDVGPSNSTTFMRYFGSENSLNAVLAEEANNGFTLLANSQIATDNFGSFSYQIKLVHTDFYGHKQWETKFPKFSFADGKKGGFKASSFITINSGYLIVGSDINEQGNSNMLLLETGPEGDSVRSLTISLAGQSLEGRAITKVTTSSSEYYLVLGNITSNNAVKDMYIAKIPTDLSSVEWARFYGDRKNNVTNRLFLSEGASPNIVWSSSVLNFSAKTEMRLVLTPQDTEAPSAETELSELNLDQLAFDICKKGNDYAVVGSIIDAEGQDKNLLFSRATVSNSNIQVVSSTVIKETENGNRKEEGISICPAHEGGYMIYGNVETGDAIGNGKDDYYLVKVSAFGEKEWSTNFGGSDTEQAASIRPTSDGGYILFGTTAFGSLNKALLMKVDKNGKL